MAFSSKKLSFQELKELLDEKVELYNTPKFLPNDPLGLVHEFSEQGNQEIIAFLLSTIAWGNRKSIIKSGQKLIEIFDGQPSDFVLNASSRDLKNLKFVHRTFQNEDLVFFILSLRRLIQKSGTLESHFSLNPNEVGIKGRIINFRNQFFLEESKEHRSNKHLSNPLKGSSSKRINMFLRWMVRPNDEGVDLGLWKNIPLAELCIPLDVHTGNVSRELGFTNRKANDWKTLEEIMGVLRKMDPYDPAKYDFALFGLGVIDPLSTDN
jgi:uncharacterized protein (TIGR02757 family)